MSGYSGWVGNVFLLAGAWAVGGRRRWGFLATAAGEAVWSAYVAWLGHWDMLFICVTFGLMAGWNYFRWAPAGEKVGGP